MCYEKLISNCLVTYRIIHTTLVVSMEVFKPFPGYYFFNILLMVLQALHIYWAGLILRMIYKLLNGKVRKCSEAQKYYKNISDVRDLHVVTVNGCYYLEVYAN